MKPNKTNKKSKTDETKKEVKRLKAENSLLLKQRNKLKAMLLDLVRKWRNSDEKTANVCYDSCRLVSLTVAAMDYKLGSNPNNGKS
jgi:predicted nuclease with TOPRIM domain